MQFLYFTKIYFLYFYIFNNHKILRETHLYYSIIPIRMGNQAP